MRLSLHLSVCLSVCLFHFVSVPNVHLSIPCHPYQSLHSSRQILTSLGSLRDRISQWSKNNAMCALTEQVIFTGEKYHTHNTTCFLSFSLSFFLSILLSFPPFLHSFVPSFLPSFIHSFLPPFYFNRPPYSYPTRSYSPLLLVIFCIHFPSRPIHLSPEQPVDPFCGEIRSGYQTRWDLGLESWNLVC